MSQIHSVTLMPAAVIPAGNYNSSIGHRVASTNVAASGASLSAVSKSLSDQSRPTPSETLVRKADGSSAVEVTISWGGGKTSTYEKFANAAQTPQHEAG